LSHHARLSALDAGFLAMESPITPMHIGSVAVFEGQPLRDEGGRIRMAELRALVEERLDRAPRFRQVARSTWPGLGRPVWVDDPNFDVAHHVKTTTVRAPGQLAQLLELGSELHAELLDRSRPLWEMWVVDGLADGRVGWIEKVHHSMVDGVAGVDFAAALMDLAPTAGPSPGPGRTGGGQTDSSAHPAAGQRKWTAQAAPGLPELAVASLRQAVEAQANVLGQIRRIATQPRQSFQRAAALIKGTRSLVQGGLVAPRLSVNCRLTGSRRSMDSVTVSLADIKAVGKAFGVTVNDVVLAATASGLGNLLRQRDEAVVHARALVPVSTRAADAHGEMGNSVAAMLIPLPVGETDPLRCLEAVSREVRKRKAAGQAGATGRLIEWADRLPAAVSAGLAGTVHHQPFVNLVVTNVPGSPVPLYMLGARLQEAVPVVPLARNLDLSVGILSYAGALCFGFLADAELVPDLHVLAEGVEKSLAELIAAANPES